MKLKFCCILFVLNFLIIFADLRADLREFATLIPRRRIAFLAARYFIFDPEFRAALDFMGSKKFKEVHQQIKATDEYKELVNYLKTAGGGAQFIKMFDRLTNRLRNFKLPEEIPVDLMLGKDFSTFMRDGMDALPQKKIANLMVKKIGENGDFAKFYKAMRSEKFKELVDDMRHSKNLTEPLQRLLDNGLDVDELIDVVFTMLSWGP